jgi:uncharacterized protein YeaO (DUF488 family)
MSVRLRRAYDQPAPDDGYRVLVDRIWPRGVSKEHAEIDEWARDLAPSGDLRRWFGHDPQRWEEFQRRYRDELDRNSDAVDRLAQRASQGRVTLVYSARDQERNNAVVLRDVLERRRTV